MSNTESDSLVDLLKAWIDTDTWNKSAEFLKANAEQLLSDEAIAALDLMIKEHEVSVGESAGDLQYLEVLQQHRTILEASRAYSVDETYEELLKRIELERLEAAVEALAATKSPAELREQIQHHPVLLTEQGFAFIDWLLEGLRQSGQEEKVGLLEERYETLKQIKANVETMSEPIPADLLQLIQEWIDTDTWEQSRAMLKAHAERLLSDEALRAVMQLLAAMADEDEKAVQTLLRHRAILEKARAESIDVAYAELLKPSPFQEVLQVLWAADNPWEIRQVVTQYPLLCEEETLNALLAMAERAERDGNTAVAQILRLRVSEVQRIRAGLKSGKQSGQGERLADEVPLHDLSDETIRGAQFDVRDHSIGGIIDNRGGNINQENIEYRANKEWQPGSWSFRPGKDFVGREDKVNTLLEHLDAGEHATITGQSATVQGMAGIGKTYLARKLADELQHRFPGGFIWVTLGPKIKRQAETKRALNELAKAAFGGKSSGAPIKDLQPATVASWLDEMAPGRFLVVFDDAWRLEPLQLLSEALPKKAVRLVTTRFESIARALGDHPVTLDKLTEEEGLALLHNRLDRRLEAPEVTRYEADLKQLVSFLEGHALALDIISGVIKKVSSIPKTLEKLRNEVGSGKLDGLKLKLLDEEEPNTSVKKSLELSYDVMNVEQKSHFRALGVFETGTVITLEAAQAVWGMEDLSAAEDALADLEDFSLLTEVTEEETNALCYRQHSLLRAYARGLLDDEGELTSTYWAYAQYYAEMVTNTQVADYPSLDQHIPNILAALHWAAKHEPAILAQLLAESFQLLLVRGQAEEIEGYFPEAIRAAGAIGRTTVQARLFLVLGDLERRLGNIDQARAHYDAALPLFRLERARLGEAYLLQSLGDLESRLGNIDQARAHYDAALPLYRLERARLGEASIYRRLADSFLNQEDLMQAKAYYEQALPLFIVEREPIGQANSLFGLGRINFATGEYDQGTSNIQQAAELYRRTQDEEGARNAERYLAEMHAQLEQPSTGEEAPSAQQALIEALLATDTPQAVLQLARQHPQLLSDEWLALLESLINAQTDEGAKKHIEERFETLKQIRETSDQRRTDVAEAMKVLIDFANANWSERHSMLNEHGDVLLNEGVEALCDLLQESVDAEAVEPLRILLRRSRTYGVDATWYFEMNMRLGDGIEIPSEYEPAVMQVAALLARQQEEKTALTQAIEIMQELLDRLTVSVPPLFEAALLRDLAYALFSLPQSHPARRLDLIEAHYRKALPDYQNAERPISVAFVKRALGDVLSEQGRDAEALDLLQEAIETLRADEYYRRDTTWALSSYASILDNLGQIEEALAAYDEAITLLPDTPPLLRNRAETLIHARRLDKAEADVQRAVELDGNEESPYLWYRRAQLALAQGVVEQAERMIEEVRQRDANHDVTFLQAQCAWLRGDIKQAKEYTKQATEKVNKSGRGPMLRDLQRLHSEHEELVEYDALVRLLIDTSVDHTQDDGDPI